MVAKAKTVVIPQLKVDKQFLTIEGLSPLVTHPMAEKAKKMMLDKKQGKSHKSRTVCDPVDEFLGSLYWISERPEDNEEAMELLESGEAVFGVSAVAVKAATCRGAKGLDGIDMTSARGMLFVKGQRVPWHECDLLPIIGPPPTMLESVITVKSGSSDLRYRPIWEEWAVQFEIQYDAAVLTAEQVVNLVNIGGSRAGLHEGRPEKSPLSWGRFQVQT